MPKEVELEGTPAEATWAMITVLVVVIVVLIFCCLVPFYRALEKRYHHWEDEENDPRWDNDQFQFSPTSPRLERSASNSNYNRLSVCSGEGSSGTTSTLNVNNSFKNQSLLPRFEDQVEFKLPKKFYDGFNSGSIDEEENQESSPNFKSYEPKSSSAKKFGRTAKKVIEPSPLSLPRVDHTNETQNSQVLSNKPTEQKVQATVEKEPVKKTRQQDLDARLAQLQAKKAAAATSKPTVSEPAPAPVAPPKRNSRLMTPSEPGRARPGSGRSSEVIKPQPDSGTVSPPAPARKTNRKTQKT